MFSPARVPERFRPNYARAERRFIREIAVKAGWALLVLSAIANASVLIRGGSLIDTGTFWACALRVPPLVVALLTLAFHYARLPGQWWPLVMLRLLALSAMWSVLGLLVFAYDQGGAALRLMTELTIMSIFCAALISLRGVRGTLFPLVVPLTAFFAFMVSQGHDPNQLGLHLFSFLPASGIAVTITHRLYNMRVSEFVARQEINELATVDSLTGLLNRRAMNERLESERARFSRRRTSFSILLVNLDHFTAVNDELGRAEGDRMVREVAGRLKRQTRPQDAVARWGGEGFMILLPDTEEKGAIAAAEKLRVALHQDPFEIGTGRARKQTGSFGVAIYDGKETSTNLISRADKALYMAKECGRNRVVMA